MSPLTFLLWVGVIALAVLVLGFVWFIMSAHIEWVDSDGDVFDEPFVAWGEDR